MKKFISFVMAAVLCVGMTTTVFAADSATTDGVTGAGSVDKVVTDGADVEVLPLDTAEAEFAGIEKASYALEAINTAAASIGATRAWTLSYFEVVADAGSTLTFYDSSIVAGSNIVVLHYNTTTNVWENVTVEVGNGYVKAQSATWSPVMIVSYDDTPAPTYNYSDEPVSPKTADVAMFGLYAAVALAGTVTAARKAKASK